MPKQTIKSPQPIKSFKGFDKNLKCRDFQYVIGETYKHEGDVKACASGFHACEYPLDVFNYYNPAESVFCQVEQSGTINKGGDDTKVSSSEIKIVAAINVHGLVSASIDFILARVKKTKKKSAHNTGDYSAASNTGYQSAASNTGNQSAASNTGNRSAASNTGYQSAASNTGNRSAASNTGDYSAASNTGNRSAASNTGDYSAASNTGDYSAASNTGYQSAASIEGKCKESIAAGFGYQNKARASDGNWIVLVHRNDSGEILHIASAKAGKDVKPDTWYMLTAKGKFEEVASHV